MPKIGELMAKEFFIPQLGQTVEEVILVKWLVPDGTRVSQGQEVIEVETDKATFPVEANSGGYIHIGPYQEGDVIPVLTVVAVIGTQQDTFQLPQIKTKLVPEDTSREGGTQEISPVQVDDRNAVAPIAASTQFISPRARRLAVEKKVDLSHVSPTGFGGMRIVERDVTAYLGRLPKVTPLAQRMATVAEVDPRTLTGTGPGGRVVKEDVRRASNRGTLAADQVSLAGTKLSSLPAYLPSEEVLNQIPLRGVRAIIAERLGRSAHSTAPVTLVMEADATDLVAGFERFKPKVAGTWGFTPGYSDLFAKITAAGLQEFRYMNARLALDSIEIMAHINIGMAVDTDRGLLVPVIRDVDRKTLRQFGDEFRLLAEKARTGRSLPDELTGGTFTITNLGMYDVDAFTPVINPPEAAILGIGRIAPQPVAMGGQVLIRQMCTLSLVFDHRLVDGAPAARFLQYLKHQIEKPDLFLVE